MFAVDESDGSLTSLGWESSRGKTPKSFVVYGDWMVVANQDSDTMHTFAINAATGLLTYTGKSYDVGTPERVFMLQTKMSISDNTTSVFATVHPSEIYEQRSQGIEKAQGSPASKLQHSRVKPSVNVGKDDGYGSKHCRSGVEQVERYGSGNQDAADEHHRIHGGLPNLITRFETEVKEYERVVNAKKNILKKLLAERPTTKCSIDASATYRSEGQVKERNKRYMDFVDSSETINAMGDQGTRGRFSRLLLTWGRRNYAMMQNSLDTRDHVVSAMKEKLRASLSRSTRADISNLPDWYMTEDKVDIDMSMAIGFGGDAKVYKGVIKDDATVAVKVFNANAKK
ncbi:hypothetical protein ON010_g17181 [Phytophthora cinnamomi]|nr:hypothetical protein ON010_g17181 [Phytophthora cinnamomi]